MIRRNTALFVEIPLHIKPSRTIHTNYISKRYRYLRIQARAFSLEASTERKTYMLNRTTVLVICILAFGSLGFAQDSFRGPRDPGLRGGPPGAGGPLPGLNA